MKSKTATAQNIVSQRTWVKLVGYFLLTAIFFLQIGNIKASEKRSNNLLQVSQKFSCIFFGFLQTSQSSKFILPIQSSSDSNEYPYEDDNEPIDEEDDFYKQLDFCYYIFNHLNIELPEKLLFSKSCKIQSTLRVPLFVLFHSWKIAI
jgi:hypothetical protein